jgi:hypothetical protein
MIKMIFDSKKKVKIKQKIFRSQSGSSTLKYIPEKSVEYYYIKGIKEKLFQQTSQIKQNFYIPILFQEKIYLAKVKLKNLE